MSDGGRHAGEARTLAVITAVRAGRDGDRLILDRKALEGIEYRVRHWPGPVCWMLAMTDEPPGYAVSCDPASLPFKVIAISPDRTDVPQKAPPGALIEASADDFSDLDLSRALPGQVVYSIEYTLRTRMAILRAETGTWHGKLRTAIWELLTERRRRRAIRAAAGLQCNGLPSYGRYAAMARTAMHYFDTRLTRETQVDEPTLAAKQRKIEAGEPLRLAFSGRINRMKGAHFLLPLMRELHGKGLDFRFEIFGSGPVLPELEAAAAGELAGKLICHGPVPFAEELVPAMKTRIDLFICPHPQGDPSCTYMETLGCGVPIVGFANEAWQLMASGRDFGEVVPLGNVDAMAQAVIRLDKDRARLADMARAAAEFGWAQPFERAFEKRLEHLAALAGVRVGNS